MDYLCLFKNNIEKIREYLQDCPKHIDIFRNGKTPLMYAATQDRIDIVDFLIASGANVNLQCKSGFTALHWCCCDQQNNRDLLQRLLNAGANCLYIDLMGNTPLHYAAEDTNDVNIIHDLTLGSNPNHQNNHGYNPLMWACCSNKTSEVISALINITNDLNVPNRDRNTALHLACWNNNYNAISLLLKAGADLHITNNNNETAYELADEEGRRIIDEHLKFK